MEPTVHLGDRFAVVKFGTPDVGDCSSATRPMTPNPRRLH
jgi:signal peptidase I